MSDTLNSSLEVSGELAPAPLVVCATRGGQGSRAAQTAAIEFAKEQNARLVFLYVVDSTSYEDIEGSMQAALREELLWIGQALLQLAKNRGRTLGVSAEISVLEGKFVQQLTAFLREHAPISLVLGAPRGTTPSVFGDDQIEQLALQLEKDTGIDVMLIRPEALSAG